MDRGACWAIVWMTHKELDMTDWLIQFLLVFQLFLLNLKFCSLPSFLQSGFTGFRFFFFFDRKSIELYRKTDNKNPHMNSNIVIIKLGVSLSLRLSRAIGGTVCATAFFIIFWFAQPLGSLRTFSRTQRTRLSQHLSKICFRLCVSANRKPCNIAGIWNCRWWSKFLAPVIKDWFPQLLFSGLSCSEARLALFA